MRSVENSSVFVAVILHPRLHLIGGMRASVAIWA